MARDIAAALPRWTAGGRNVAVDGGTTHSLAEPLAWRQDAAGRVPGLALEDGRERERTVAGSF